MVYSFYDSMRERKLHDFEINQMSQLRYRLRDKLSEDKLEVPSTCSNAGLETAVLYNVVKEWLGIEEEPAIQLEKLDLRKYRSGAPYLTYEYTDSIIQEHFVKLAEGVDYEINNTVLFPFGALARDPLADITRMNPEQVTAYYDSPDNLVSYSQVLQYALDNQYNFMALYDVHLNQKDSTEVVGESQYSAWDFPNRISQDQASRIWCRVFCMSKSYEALRYLDNEYKATVLESFSKPKFIETFRNRGYVKKWWVTQSPIGKDE